MTVQEVKAVEKMAEQLCWSCSKACGGSDCPWANKLQPVEGWVAKKKTTKDCGQEVVSYRITECPLFERKKE